MTANSFLRKVRRALSLSGAGPAWGIAARSVVAFLPPMLIGIAAGAGLEGAVAAIAGQIVALGDSGGPFGGRLRLVAVTAFSFVVLIALGIYVAGSVVAATLVFGALAFASSLMLLYGPAARLYAGMPPVVVFISYSLGVPASEALPLAGAAAVGAAWAVVVSVVWWLATPTRRRADVVAASLGITRDLCAVLADPEREGRSVDEIRDYRRRFAVSQRDATAAARHLKLWDGVSGLNEVAAVDDLFVAVVAYASMRLPDDGTWPDLSAAEHGLFGEIADYTGACQAAIARSDRPPPAPAAVRASLDAVAAEQPRHRRTIRALRHGLDGIVDPPVGTPSAYMPGVWDVLVAGWNRRSPVLRHSLRLAITAMAATLVFELTSLPEGYWVLLTVLVIMKPEIGGTVDRVVQRTVGTMIGVGIAAGLLALVSGMEYVTALVAVPFAFAMAALRPVNYFYWVIPLTPYVLLSISVGVPDDVSLAFWRLVNTGIGAALALVATMVLWPSRTRIVIPGTIATALRAAGDYLSTVTARSAASVRNAARARALVANANARGAVEQCHDEPGLDPDMVARFDRELSLSTQISDMVMQYDVVTREDPSQAVPDVAGAAHDAIDDAAESVERTLSADAASAHMSPEGADARHPLAAVLDRADAIERLETESARRAA